MDKVMIELTKEEAALLPHLYKIPVTTNLESAGQVMKNRLILDGLMQKVSEAFAESVKAETPAPVLQSKRKRH